MFNTSEPTREGTLPLRVSQPVGTVLAQLTPPATDHVSLTGNDFELSKSNVEVARQLFERALYLEDANAKIRSFISGAPPNERITLARLLVDEMQRDLADFGLDPKEVFVRTIDLSQQGPESLGIGGPGELGAPSFPISDTQVRLSKIVEDRVGERPEANVMRLSSASGPNISMDDLARQLGLAGEPPKTLVDLANRIGIPSRKYELEDERLTEVGPRLFARRTEKGAIELYFALAEE